jgi:TolB-like protein/Tfp pilus assembly protein PilF
MASVWGELKRRNVIKVAIAYVIVAWLILQIGDTLGPALRLPDAVNTALAFFLILGFPLAVFFAWAFELTPDGLKKEKDVDRSESITNITGRKLDFAIIGILAIALVFFASTHQWGSESERADSPYSAKLGAQSIAVLPFVNRSNRDEDLFFTDGIHDDLLTQLAKINDLKVISRTSVMHYRNTDMRIPQIAQELGVATVLEGGVQRAGQRIRINAQLIDVATDQHIWAETYDREMTIANLFDIQTEITRQIVTAVRGQLTAEEQQVFVGAPTQSLEAYEAYLHARNLLTRSGYNLDKYKAALPYAEEAVALDPNFTLAHLQIATIHARLVWMGYDVSPEREQAARTSLNKAAAILNPESPELLAAQGEFLYRFEHDYPAALNAFRKSHAAMPGNTSVLARLGFTQRRVGLWEESVDSLLRSADLDPANASSMAGAAETLGMMQQWSRLEELYLLARPRYSDDTDLGAEEAMFPLWSRGDVASSRELYDRVRPNVGENYFFATIEIPWFEHDFAGVIKSWERPEVREFASLEGFAGYRDLQLAMAKRYLGQTDRADLLLEGIVQQLTNIGRNRPNPVVALELGTLALALALQGESSRAIAIAEEATRMVSLQSDKVDGPWHLKVLCLVLALSGERDRALEIMAHQIDKPAGFKRWELYLDPRWDFFRDDHRFHELVRPGNLEQSSYAKESNSQ